MAQRVAGWYDDSWSTRFAVSVPHTVSPSGTNDVRIAVPKSHPIWEILAAEGSENSVRVTDGDGYTALTFQLTKATFSGTWSTANKDGGILINDAAFVAGTSVKLLWVYCGNASASSAAGSVTPSGPITGYLYQALPPRPGAIVRGTPDAPGETVASPDVSKRSGESRRVWVALNPLLSGRARAVEGSIGLDSIWGVTTSSETGGSGASVHDATKTRYIEDADGAFYASAFMQGGSDGTDYLYKLSITTGDDMSNVNNTDQTLESTFRLRVNDASEA